MTGNGSQFTIDQTTPAQVAAAVLAVLRDLHNAPVARPKLSDSLATEQIKPLKTFESGKKEVSDPTRHHFSGSILLERHAMEISREVRELTVLPKTVVTPLAREILRKNGVAIRFFGSAGGAYSNATKAGQWAVIRLSGSAQALAAESLLAGRTGDGWDLAGNSLEDAASWLSQGPGRHVGVLAEVACVEVWRLAGAGVRAAQASATGDVETIVKNFAPQSLVVEPAKMPIHEIKQIFHAWRQMGVVPVPVGLMGIQAKAEAAR